MEIYYNNEGPAGKYIMQELNVPGEKGTPEALAEYESLGKKRIHWMDNINMPGCNQINTSWYFEANRDRILNGAPIGDPALRLQTHKHASDEIICYYGSDPDDPYNLNAEIEMILDGKTYIITKSTLIYVPAGMVHSTPVVNKLTKPVFHFSMVMSPEYDFIEVDE